MEAEYTLGNIQLFTKEQTEILSVEMSFNKAPLIIHQSFCYELVRLAKEQDGKKLEEIPEAMKVMDAIDVIERLYPKLKNGKTKK